MPGGTGTAVPIAAGFTSFLPGCRSMAYAGGPCRLSSA
uniref:Uncharacterized protein n=1 Tax=Anguilla anguilla TaxID=7936 RepID=A0A0E9S274_ANGAN